MLRPDLAALHTQVSSLFTKLENPWFCSHKRIIPDALLLATDARCHIAAWVIYDQSGNVIHADTRTFDPPIEISLAETKALSFAWRDVVTRNLLKDLHFIINGIDNTVASRTLAKCYSVVDENNTAVLEALNILPSHISPLFVDLHTLRNVAGIPTRDPSWTICSLNQSALCKVTFDMRRFFRGLRRLLDE